MRTFTLCIALAATAIPVEGAAASPSDPQADPTVTEIVAGISNFKGSIGDWLEAGYDAMGARAKEIADEIAKDKV